MRAPRPELLLLPLPPCARAAARRAEEVAALAGGRVEELARAVGIVAARLTARARRHAPQVQVARSVLAYTLRHHDGLTYSEIARVFRRRGPTAGVYLVRRGEAYVAAHGAAVPTGHGEAG